MGDMGVLPEALENYLAPAGMGTYTCDVERFSAAQLLSALVPARNDAC